MSVPTIAVQQSTVPKNGHLTENSYADAISYDFLAASMPTALYPTTKTLLKPPSVHTFDLFGSAVAAGRGGNVLVGARFDDTGAINAGAAYLFDTADGSLLREFLNPTPAEGDDFGISVAIVGTNVLIGAPGDDTGATNAGTAYLFDGDTGSLLKTFLNPTPATDDHFGLSVAAVGDNVLVGAPQDDTGDTDAGAAYLFNGTTGSLLQTFVNPTPAFDDQFGRSVAGISEDVLVGAFRDDTAATNSGAAYLFDASTGSLLRTLLNPSAAPFEWFGFSVAGIGDNILVGAPYRDIGAAARAGAAYLFDRTTGSLITTILNPTPASDDWFGFSVAAAFGTVLVGALFDDTGATDSGAAYVFDEKTGSLLGTFLNPTPAVDDEFGYSVAFLFGLPVVGSPNDDAGAQNAGAVHLFESVELGGRLLRTFQKLAVAVDDKFGYSVAAVGSNMVVGAPFDDAGATDAGAVYVFEGATGTLLRTILNPTPATDDRFGYSVAGFGHDILIGAPGDDTGGSDSGAVYLFEATTGQLLRTFLSPEILPAHDALGSSVASVGNSVVVGAVWGGDPDPPFSKGGRRLSCRGAEAEIDRG